jgi:hypothetical protein
MLSCRDVIYRTDRIQGDGRLPKGALNIGRNGKNDQYLYGMLALIAQFDPPRMV